MSFKVIQGTWQCTNRKLEYESLLLGYSNFRRITHRFPDTNCLMLKTTFLPTQFVFDLEFGGHAVGMWR